MFSSASTMFFSRRFSRSSLVELQNVPLRKPALQNSACTCSSISSLKNKRTLLTASASKNASASLSPSDRAFSQSTLPIANSGENHENTIRRRRQTMTAREIRAFDEMFDIIFQNDKQSQKPSTDANIGLRKGESSALISRLRRHTRRMRKTTDVDEILDLKKQEIASCRSDQELLEWSMREVFAESQRYDEEAQLSSNGGGSQGLINLQPPAYPHLIALLMRVFRDQYHDPYLALSIFEHAKNLSTASYVFGCSTLAYNELLETRWKCFRDLKGVQTILEEMRTNGVLVDSHTRTIVDNLRRQIGEENLWVRDNDAGADGVWSTIARIDNLITNQGNTVPNRRKWRDWKERSLDDRPDDKWQFGDWSTPGST